MAINRKKSLLLALKLLFKKPQNIRRDTEIMNSTDVSRRFTLGNETTYVLTPEEELRTTFFTTQMEDILRKFSDEQRLLLEKEVTSVYDLFHDEKFIMVYFYGNHESLIKYIEELYFSNKMNARMLRALMDLGIVELTSKDNERFGLIHLLYSWDDPIYEGEFTEEDILNYYKRQMSIK